MRRPFLHLLAIGLVAASCVTTPALAQTLKVMVPANAGGGYDGTGRTLGKALIETGAFKTVTYENRAGAGGTLGLAQFANANKGDPSYKVVSDLQPGSAGLKYMIHHEDRAIFIIADGDGYIYIYSQN